MRAAVLAAALLLAGCTHLPSIEGKWDSGSRSYLFRRDGTYSYDTGAPAVPFAASIAHHITRIEEGNYLFDGRTLTLHVAKATDGKGHSQPMPWRNVKHSVSFDRDLMDLTFIWDDAIDPKLLAIRKTFPPRTPETWYRL